MKIHALTLYIITGKKNQRAIFQQKSGIYLELSWLELNLVHFMNYTKPIAAMNLNEAFFSMKRVLVKL